MITPDVDSLLSRTKLVRFATNLGERDQLYQCARRGEMTRVIRGCYVEATYWHNLSPADRHRALAQLCALSFGDELVFSHRTAAALWRVPVLGAWPSRAHIAGSPNGASHRSASIARHALGIEVAPELIDGLRVTHLAATVAQIAATESFGSGLVVADAAMRRATHPFIPLTSTVSKTDLLDAASRISLNHGGARAMSVAGFADGRADRPGESLSRASMKSAGLPLPELQVDLLGASGRRYFVDFYWRDLRLIGEFDGKAKYSDPQFLRGRTPEQALTDEKFREDDLRATSHAFSRWGWEVALSPARLALHLRRAGLR